ERRRRAARALQQSPLDLLAIHRDRPRAWNPRRCGSQCLQWLPGRLESLACALWPEPVIRAGWRAALLQEPEEHLMPVRVRPLVAADYEAWLPLWQGYLQFYKTSVP